MSSFQGAVVVAKTPLPTFPRLPEWLAIRQDVNNDIHFSSARLSYTVSLPLFVQIFKKLWPLLDGSRSIEILCQEASEFANTSTTTFFLKTLAANGLIFDGDESLYSKPVSENTHGELAEYFSNFTPNPIHHVNLLAECRVTLVSSRDCAQVFKNSMRDAGFAHVVVHEVSGPKDQVDIDAIISKASHQGTSLVVAALAAHSQSLFEKINLSCLDHAVRWLRVEGDETSVTLGPSIFPRQTACYTCLLYRQRSHLPARYDRTKHEIINTSAQIAKTPSSIWRLAAAHAAIECSRLIAGFAPPTTIAQFNVLSGTSLEPVSHSVLKLPRCPSCGVSHVQFED